MYDEIAEVTSKEELFRSLEQLTEINAHGDGYVLLARWCKVHADKNVATYNRIIKCLCALNELVEHTHAVIDAKLRYDMSVRLNQLIIEDFGGEFLDELNKHR